MAIQSSFKNMVICLTIICLVCSALLGGAYALTKDAIDAADAKKTSDAIAQVVPAFEGEPVAAVIEVGGKEYTYYSLSNGSYAIEAVSSGFGGALKLMVGVTPEGVIYNTSVLSHAETPGLGAKCTEPAFADQFREFDPAVKKLSVKKDGGDVDAITASTITSRAYCKALEVAMAIYAAIGGEQVDADAVSGASTPAADVEPNNVEEE